MRPSKLRLPLSTDATTRSCSVTTFETSSGSGPELPIQVVHPYPTTLNFSFSRNGINPERVRYSVTTSEPGASEVLTQAGTFKPFLNRFLRQQAGANQHGRIRSVGATGDGGDDDAAVIQATIQLHVLLHFVLLRVHAGGDDHLHVSQRDACLAGTCCPGFSKRGERLFKGLRCL